MGRLLSESEETDEGSSQPKLDRGTGGKAGWVP